MSGEIGMYKGIFWLRVPDQELIVKKVSCNAMGVALAPVVYSSKSGDNFNHKAEWDNFSKRITSGRPYNYYPRGRVEVRNGCYRIFVSPYIGTDTELVELVLQEFKLKDMAGEIHIDNSWHYRNEVDGDVQ